MWRRRPIFTLGAAVSAVVILLLIASLIWVKRQHLIDEIRFKVTSRSFLFHFTDYFGWSTHEYPIGADPVGGGRKEAWSFAGIHHLTWPGGNGETERLVLVSIWYPFVVSSAWCACWFASWWRLCREQQAGLCNSCGYDLRGSGDRCPECGTKRSA